MKPVEKPAVRRVETSGGASFELPERSSARPELAKQVPPAASERIRVQRAGEPEFVLREGVLYTAGGIQVTADQQPDWARNCIMTAALAIRRVEFVNAKIRARNPQNEEI